MYKPTHKSCSANQTGTRRIWTFVSLTAIVPLGFYTKFYDGPQAGWVNHSLGGVFYEIFWCLLVFFLLPGVRAWTIALCVLAITCALEFAQLWHPPALTLVRSHLIGATLLGTTFSWYDFPYYLVGVTIGWAGISMLKYKSRL